MAQTKWTAAQAAAIGYRGRNLLLSAAAGSGKTATLTGRIVSLLTDPDSEAEISRMLCVTFTRAAAAELRERIGRALREALAADKNNARLTRQLCDLGRAQITTIHAFCLSVLRPHAAELGLPAGFAVAQQSEADSLARQAMTDVLSSFFEAGEEDFLRLADTLGGARSEASLDDAMLSLAASLAGRGMDGASLAALSEPMDGTADFFSSPAGAGTRARLMRFAGHYRSYFDAAAQSFAEDEKFSRAYLPAAAACRDASDALLRAASDGSYSRAREVLAAFSPPARLGTVRAEFQTDEVAFFKDIYAAFKKEMASLRERSFALTEEETALAASRTADVCRTAARVLDAYFEELNGRKRERGIVDFTDLETMTARLFLNADGTPSAAAREAGEAFDYIFIDEYQDTNRMQDAIFTALSAGGGRRFMVGDIKQSIYRFRGAEPEVFASYRRKWQPAAPDAAPDGDGGESIFMRENFRCDRTVVDFVNTVSRHIFASGSIPFTPDDELAYAKAQPPEYTASPVEVRLLPSRAGEEETVDEAEYVARRISALLGHARRADGTPLAASDIAILLRSPGADAAAFSDALARRGIRVSDRTASSLYEEPEVALMVSILRAVDNPSRDIDLAGAMKSPVFGFTLDDLIRIRRAGPDGSLWDAVRQCAGILPAAENSESVPGELAGRCAAFCARLGTLRTDARGMKTDRLLLRLYAETDAMRLPEASPDRDSCAVSENLLALYETARRFENGGAGGGLYAFLRSIEEAQDEGAADSAQKDDGDAVRILSIHQSKGLEFPVCFLARAAKKRNLRDTTAPVLFEPSVGAVMRLPDEGGLVRCDTPLRRSVAAAIADACAEEEMRVLYVAMTRARERLIVTASLPDPEAALDGCAQAAPYVTAYSLYDADRYIDWILGALAAARLRGEESTADVAVVREAADNGAPAAAVRTDDAPHAAAEPAEIQDWMRLFSTRFSFVYPYAHLAGIPAKLTVSRLYPGILDEDGEGERTELSRAPQPVSMPEKNRAPRFLSGKTEFEASFAGTATHVFMQFCDFERLARDGAAEELSRLRSAGFLTEAMADAVRLDEIERFRSSALLLRMRRAVRVRREFRFNAALPACGFTRDEALAEKLRETGTDVIVQGVVDCLFEEADGRVVLVDYKTDRLSAQEIREPALAAKKLCARHADQLRYYRAVCARMLARPVDECLIYSLPLGEALSVPAQELRAKQKSD